MELGQVPVHSLVPPALQGVESVADFMQQLPEHDDAMAAQLAEAEAQNECLRFVGAPEPAACQRSALVTVCCLTAASACAWTRMRVQSGLCCTCQCLPRTASHTKAGVESSCAEACASWHQRSCRQADLVRGADCLHACLQAWLTAKRGQAASS